MSADIIKAGVMGWPVEHSLSPRLHGYWLKKYKINGCYEKLAVRPDNLESELRNLKAKGFRGVNLTVPHKEAALDVVDHCSERAAFAGAINTVTVNGDGTLAGDNTDIFGFMQNMVAGGFNPGNKTAVILGAGGAARGAIAGLLESAISTIRIVNRTRAHAENLAKIFSKQTATAFSVHDWNDASVLEKADLLVNASVLGLEGQQLLVLDLEPLPKTAFVTDMVYTPLMTELLKAAKTRGNPVIDGLGMLLHQARPAFKAFFGVDPEVTSELRQHVLEGLA